MKYFALKLITKHYIKFQHVGINLHHSYTGEIIEFKKDRMKEIYKIVKSDIIEFDPHCEDDFMKGGVIRLTGDRFIVI